MNTICAGIDEFYLRIRFSMENVLMRPLHEVPAPRYARILRESKVMSIDSSIDRVIAEMYEMVSFEPGTRPD